MRPWLRQQIVIAVVGLLATLGTWIVTSVVHGGTTEAVLTERISAHEARIGELEGVARSLADSQARTVATQAAIADMLQRMDTRHDADLREIRESTTRGRK